MLPPIVKNLNYLMTEGLANSWQGTIAGSAAGAVIAKIVADHNSNPDHKSGSLIILRSVALITLGSFLGTIAGFTTGVAKGILKPQPERKPSPFSLLLGLVVCSTSISIPISLILNNRK